MIPFFCGLIAPSVFSLRPVHGSARFAQLANPAATHRRLRQKILSYSRPLGKTSHSPSSPVLMAGIFLSKESIMPMVGKKKFPYTKAGKEDAAMYAKKSGMKKKPAPKKK